MNQEILKWGRIALIVLVIFLAAETLGALKSLRDTDPAYNSISVSGEGEVVAIPDVATFYFTVSRDGTTASEAQSEVTTRMNAILDNIKAQGVEEKDIKTTDYSLVPKYRYESTARETTMIYPVPSRQIPDGYTVSHTVMIKVRDASKSGDLLTLVGDNGATYVSGLSFTVDEQEQLIEEARAQAIADAKEKAEMLSDELGVKLVRVVSFYDNSGQPTPYYGYSEGMGGDMVKNVAAVAPSIPAGENKIKIVVTVTYEIR